MSINKSHITQALRINIVKVSSLYISHTCNAPYDDAQMHRKCSNLIIAHLNSTHLPLHTLRKCAIYHFVNTFYKPTGCLGRHHRSILLHKQSVKAIRHKVDMALAWWKCVVKSCEFIWIGTTLESNPRESEREINNHQQSIVGVRHSITYKKYTDLHR